MFASFGDISSKCFIFLVQKNEQQPYLSSTLNSDGVSAPGRVVGLSSECNSSYAKVAIPNTNLFSSR